MMPLCVDLSMCFIFKNRDILLSAHSTVIKLESTVLMLCYYPSTEQMQVLSVVWVMAFLVFPP